MYILHLIMAFPKITFGFSLFEHSLGITFQLLLNYFVWLRITDEGLVSEMRIWSLLLITSESKWCIQISRSLFSMKKLFLIARVPGSIHGCHSYNRKAEGDGSHRFRMWHHFILACSIYFCPHRCLNRRTTNSLHCRLYAYILNCMAI